MGPNHQMTRCDNGSWAVFFARLGSGVANALPSNLGRVILYLELSAMSILAGTSCGYVLCLAQTHTRMKIYCITMYNVQSYNLHVSNRLNVKTNDRGHEKEGENEQVYQIRASRCM